MNFLKYLNFNIIGNLFYLDKEINWKTILESVSLAFLIGALAYFLEGIEPNFLLNIKNFLYLILALSLISILSYFNNLKLFFKKYYKFNILTVSLTTMEIILAISIISIWNKQIFGWILASFWLFSGLLRVLIQSTPVLFYGDLNKFIGLIRIFAYNRAAYFSLLGLLIISNIVRIDSSLQIVFFSLLLVFTFLMISNLNPYLTNKSSVKEAIKLLRIIKEEKIIKINKLKDRTKLSENYFERLIKRWDKHNLIDIRNNRVELSKTMELV